MNEYTFELFIYTYAEWVSQGKQIVLAHTFFEATKIILKERPNCQIKLIDLKKECEHCHD